ncbi:MAG: DUF1559 domain-containing protein [Planctomycetia bacterium]|nr:DUF1559 domain-containing protein [Planctomycetia bacterium]
MQVAARRDEPFRQIRFENCQRLPRNYSRIAGLPKFNLGKGPDDLSGPWHCKFGSDHAGICQFLFIDSHIASINTSVDMTVLNKLAVRNDGQVPGEY